MQDKTFKNALQYLLKSHSIVNTRVSQYLTNIILETDQTLNILEKIVDILPTKDDL